MKSFKEVTYKPLSMHEEFKIRLDNGNCIIKSKNDRYLESSVHFDNDLMSINSHEASAEYNDLIMLQTEYLLGLSPEVRTITCSRKLFGMDTTFTRSEFYQLPCLWHHHDKYEITPEKWTETNGVRHPIRPVPHKGHVYKRYVPSIEKTISFRLIKESDLDIFHEWHNQPRVYHFWELNKPKDELKEYIVKGIQDKHQIPMIVEIDGEPVGYYEVYWVREDRLGPYYDSDAFDRGFHFLIGNKKFLGHAITDSIIKSGLHFMFLDDPRTRRIMAEPRHDNQKVLKYAEASIGWRKVKLFDFPHKRAWLLENSREVFFTGNPL